jgi:phosphohistidine phosphatase
VTTLHLLRHAKSSWSDDGLADHDRPLAPRGERAARRLAAHLRQQRISPSTVLCSSARRAHDTLALVAPAFGPETEISVEDELYAAPSEALLRRLHRISAGTESVMLIGHNPGLQDLAVALARGGAGLQRLAQRYPTGALATLRIRAGVPWPNLGPGDADLAGLVVPREL